MEHTKQKTASPTALDSTKLHKFEGRIHRLHERAERLDIRRNATHFSIGKLLVQLRDTIIPAGQWRPYLDSPQTTKRLGFSTTTAWRYVRHFEKATQVLNVDAISALEDEGIDAASPQTLSTVAHIMAEQPKLSPDKLAGAVRNTLRTLRSQRKVISMPITQADRVDRIFRLLKVLYRTSENLNNLEIEVGQAVSNLRKLREQVA